MSAKSGFGTYKTAKTVVDAVSKKAVAETEKANPAPKSAKVTEINMEERWCMVIYTGELDAVKVPFADAVPSYVGQQVMISGAVSDRHITEVIGKTYSEDAIDDHEVRIKVLEDRPSGYYFETTLSSSIRTTTSVARMPMLTLTQAGANGFEVDSGLGVRCQVAGMYYLYAEFKFPASDFGGGDDVNMELELRTSSNVVFRRATGASSLGTNVNVSCMQRLAVGDFVAMNAWSGKWRDVGAGSAEQFYRMGAYMIAP